MKRFTLLICALIMSPFSLFAGEPLEIGAAAPAPTVTNHLGEQIDLAKLYASGPVVLYFYPRSDTPGCTRQACNLRDNYSALQQAGVTVLGVSTDKVANQQAFKDKYELPFALIADDDKALGSAFGVGGYLGMAYKRQTFLVVDGKVAWRDLSAKPDSQAQDVLDALKALGK